MESKCVIVSFLLMSLMIAQIQVEAKRAKICCPSTTARDMYNVCRLQGNRMELCARLVGCKLMEKCQPPYDKVTLESDGNAVNEYYKLGSASSVCAGIGTLQNSDSIDVVNGVVERCTNACAAFLRQGLY